jgi:hypothetical protein
VLYVDFISLDIHEQDDLVHNINKDWFVGCDYLFCSLRGLNIISSICMGLFFYY